MSAVALLAELLADARTGVVFTGAGVSTESGIPDFRSPTGVWSRHNPRDFTFAKYAACAQTRRRAWAMRREFWAQQPRPNPAHHSIARLEAADRLAAVVTQNIDGLHQAAGSRRVVELHGTSREVLCIGVAPRAGTPAGCGFRRPTQWAFERLDGGEEDPACPDCGGLVKSATVSFGQNLFPGVLDQARALFARADLVVAVGSSLQVHPAASLPAAAARAGVPLAIVNDEPTPLDGLADVVVPGRAGEILPRAAEAAVRSRPAATS